MSPSVTLFTRCRNLKDSWVIDSQDLFPHSVVCPVFAHGFWDTVNSYDLPGPIKSKWCYNIKSQGDFQNLNVLCAACWHRGYRQCIWYILRKDEVWSRVSKPVWIWVWNQINEGRLWYESIMMSSPLSLMMKVINCLWLFNQHGFSW